MREPLPFILYKRKKSRFYYAAFKLEGCPGYTSGRSTGEEDYPEAFRKACRMMASPEIRRLEARAAARSARTD